MDASEEIIIQYYEILNPSDFINSQSTDAKLAENPAESDQQQILYYIHNDSTDVTCEDTNAILENELDVRMDNEPSSVDIAEASKEVFKVITMQEGQLYITEFDNLDDIKVNTDEDIWKGTKIGYREIDLDGTRAFIEESVWQVFSKNDDLSNKVDEKKLDNARRYNCKVEGCGKCYTSAGNLLVHMRAHTGVKPFTCPLPLCAKSFTTGYSLITHLRSHSGEKPYPCLACSKSFKTSSDLSKHLRTHTGERPFPCLIPGCNKRFTTSNIRKVHERSHTGERPYICGFENCGKSFASATNHKNHIRIHTGEKPYACKIQNCRKRFTEYSSLYKHSTVHVQGCQFSCDICLHSSKSETLLRQHKRNAHARPGGGLELLYASEMPLSIANVAEEDDCEAMASMATILLHSSEEGENVRLELDGGNFSLG